jgi:hypothetical protein
MKAVTSTSFGFLRERTIKFCIVMTFISIWLLVLVIYYSKGQPFMSNLQSSVYQFLISANLITLTLFLIAGALQAISLKCDVTYKASSILVEISALVFVICFQTVAAIAFSAATPSFGCSIDGSCHESVFFAIVSWIAPILFTIHTVELILCVRRAASTNSAIWSTPAWLIQWNQITSTSTKSMSVLERGISAPKSLILSHNLSEKAMNIPAPVPQPSQPQSQSQWKGMSAQGAMAKAHFMSKEAYRSLRGEKRTSVATIVPYPNTPAPSLPPKTPSSMAQVLVIIPTKVQYAVPRLQPAPKYFIQIPENIQYSVPRLSKPPCPKLLRKERKKARAGIKPKASKLWGRS